MPHDDLAMNEVKVIFHDEGFSVLSNDQGIGEVVVDCLNSGLRSKRNPDTGATICIADKPAQKLNPPLPKKMR